MMGPARSGSRQPNDRLRSGLDGTGSATRIEALNYRSLRYVSQPLRRFQVLVGPNGSGKFNFLDIAAFLGDVLRADLQTAITGDQRLDIPMRAADGRDLLWMRKGRVFEMAIEMAIPQELWEQLDVQPYRICRYEVAIDVSEDPRFVTETLWLKPKSMRRRGPPRLRFPQGQPQPEHIARPLGSRTPNGWRKVVCRGREVERVNYRDETGTWTVPFQIAAQASALANLPADMSRFPIALWFRSALRDAQRIVLSSESMRLPCPPTTQKHGYLPDGANLPFVVQRLADDHPDIHRRWIEHVREALPDVQDITTRERPEDRHRYLVLKYADGADRPAWLVSDGTLRLLALTLLAYCQEIRGTCLIEEPENGLHPRAIETVFQSLSSVYDAQVLVATHSPLVARLADPRQLLCVAHDQLFGTDMVLGSSHPHLKDWQGSVDFGTLLATGLLG